MSPPCSAFPSRAARRRSLGLLGVGAFGTFCLPHLGAHFDLRIADTDRDLWRLDPRHGACVVSPEAVAACDIVVLAVPLSAMRAAVRRLAPNLRPGTLVLDVCSLKVKPVAILLEELPARVDIVATHPLFGPQSGRHGIAGQRIAVCDIRGVRGERVARFLRDRLRLDVVRTSPEAHDLEMAHVQGLTHLVARALMAMDMPSLSLTTMSFGLLDNLVKLVGQDSDDLFRTILVDNPQARAVAERFTATARRVLDVLVLDARMPGEPLLLAQADDHVDP